MKAEDIKTVGEAKAYLEASGGRLIDDDGDAWWVEDGRLRASWTAGEVVWADDYRPCSRCSGAPYWLAQEALPPDVPSPATSALRGDSAARKGAPMAHGFLFTFPDAIAAVAQLAVKGNEKHNPGQPLHWSYEKSKDHADCIARHLPDFDELDETGMLHAVNVFMRAGMLLQTLLETRDPELHAYRQAQRDRQARGER